MDGILNINKPAGRTSFSVVAQVRRLSGERRVGHAGTLDPDATGVLPVCLGKATRLVEFLVDDTKTYRALIELGTATDTYDAAGKVTRRGGPSGIDRARLEEALSSFRGTIRQTPPMYSAVKHRGRPLYQLARAGVSVERKSRPVKVHRLELIAWRPPLASLEVECGKGTYIRSLANDLGEALDCGAHLRELERTRCGIFRIGDALSVDKLEEAFRSGHGERHLYPMDAILQHLRAVVVNEASEDTIRKGGPLPLEPGDSPGERLCRAYAADGHFLGILRHLPDKGVWQPVKVLV